MQGGQYISKLLLLLIAFIVILFLCSGITHAEQFVYQSKLTTIYYSHPDQFQSFAEKLRHDYLALTSSEDFAGNNHIPTRVSIGELADMLFQRVQLVLDMPLPRLTVNIGLYSGKKEFSEVYSNILIKSSPDTYAQCAMNSGEAPIAFYWKKTNTIYLRTENLSMGILAHEMAHAVIDHYFIIRPPGRTSEILCQYVDKQISAGEF